MGKASTCVFLSSHLARSILLRKARTLLDADAATCLPKPVVGIAFLVCKRSEGAKFRGAVGPFIQNHKETTHLRRKTGIAFVRLHFEGARLFS